jgi:phosphoglucosamine mutase
MKFFGTDGIRGTWGQAPFDEYTLACIAAALAEYVETLPMKAPDEVKKVVIGHDGRSSAGDISKALAAAFAAAHIGAESPGLLTTPALAYATRAGRYRLGVMISASHNPAQDNGIKLFTEKGHKLADADEESIEAGIRRFLISPPPPAPPAEVKLQPQLTGLYAQHLHSLMEPLPQLERRTLVLDCANGGISNLAPEVFRHHHFAVLPIHNKPDGHNINLKCGALHPEACADAVKQQQADLGLSFDGDGDRLLASDRKGRILTGDHLLLALTLAARKRGTLKGSGAVGTVMSNFFLDEAFNAEELKLVRSDVGDRNVWSAMAEQGMNYGGEQSGHIIASDFAPTGDGLLTALLFLSAMAELETTPEAFRKKYQPYPQGLKSLRVPDKRPIADLKKLAGVSAALQTELEGHGRLLIRYSGTEPKLRLMVEAPHTAQVKDALHRMEAAVLKDFGMDEPTLAGGDTPAVQ